MRLPGRAWLDLIVDSGLNDETRYRQRAVFYPKGLLGLTYWWLIKPFHGVVFGGVQRNIARTRCHIPAVTLPGAPPPAPPDVAGSGTAVVPSRPLGTRPPTEKGSSVRGFRDFVLRGNLVELAVAFVIGLAFATVVTSFVTNLLMPLIGKIGGDPDFGGITAGGIPIGQFINDVVAFLIIAAAVYFLVVLPYTRVRERLFPQQEPAASDEVVLLTEIRDLLATGARPPRSPSEGDSLIARG